MIRCGCIERREQTRKCSVSYCSNQQNKHASKCRNHRLNCQKVPNDIKRSIISGNSEVSETEVYVSSSEDDDPSCPNILNDDDRQYESDEDDFERECFWKERDEEGSDQCCIWGSFHMETFENSRKFPGNILACGNLVLIDCRKSRRALWKSMEIL